MKSKIINGVKVFMPETREEIGVGMGLFSDIYTRQGSLPKIGMLFPLQGRYTNFTMEGVPFPIRVIYYDREWNVVDSFIASPGMRDSSISSRVWWMYEETI